MNLFWEIMYVIVTLMCVAVLPFAIFYYEVNFFLCVCLYVLVGHAGE